MKDVTKNWLKIASKDIKIAESCITLSEPLGVISHLHAAIEKTIKALYEEILGTPPKTHDLKKLALEVLKSDLQQKEFKLLNLIDKAYIDSRYPKDIEMFEKEYSIESCKQLLDETKELIRWLKSLIEKK